MKRDALTIQGRPDIKAQIYDRCYDCGSDAYIPQSTVENVFAFAESKFPNVQDLPEWPTSTYIDASCAVKLQEKMLGEGSRTIRVYENEQDNAGKVVMFRPPWPTFFVQVHRMDDHGERFDRVMEADYGLWVLLCITGKVPDVWECLSAAVNNNRHWFGHWLTYASKMLGFRRTGNYRCFKNKMSKADVVGLFDRPLEQIFSSREATANLFLECPDVHVVRGSFDEADIPPAANNRKKRVVICIKPQFQGDNGASISDYQNGGTYELRCLVSGGRAEDGTMLDRGQWRMYVRHSGGKTFWVQHGTKHPTKYAGNVLPVDAWRNATIAIFCRKAGSTSPGELKRRYLNIIGGQCHANCSTHTWCPLVLNQQKKKGRNSTEEQRTCVCKDGEDEQEAGVPCGNYASYICPHYRTCNIGICQQHLHDVKLQCNSKSPETVCFVSKEGCHFSGSETSNSEDDGAFRNHVDMENNTLPPEALGPTAIHELAQDLVFDGNIKEEDGGSRSSVLSHADSFSINSESDHEDDDSSMDGSHLMYGHFAEHDDDSENLADAGRGGAETRTSCTNGGFWSDDDNESTSGGDGDMHVMLPAHEHGNHVGNAISDEYDENNDDIRDPFDATNIFTTNTGSDQPEIVVEHYDSSETNIPLYVILNQHGHLLTRTSHKLRMNNKHRALCERLVSKSPSAVVPLVYAEAQLFPSIFWQSLDDGTVPGAMPTALWTDRTTLRQLGVASLREHAKARVTNPSLLTASDPAYHFMLLDQLSNLGARGKHTRMVLQRGFADHQGKDGVAFREYSDNAELYGETAENHANVHKLTALCRERPPHFFFTQSCNQRTCRGLRILREWITSEEALRHIHAKYGLDRDEASSYLRQTAASYVSRSWNEVADMWMRYIIHSDEAPIGPIEWGWYRKEFQG